jgi:multicomponent Na+:H+ antiporter subunit B
MKNRSLIVETVARWVAPFIFLYGLYVMVYGHLSPGGGFQGGVILSCAFVLVVLARGKERALEGLPFGLAKSLDSAAALVFLGLGLVGVVAGSGLLVNFIQKSHPGRPLHLVSAGGIPLINLAIALKVGASLFLVMVVLSSLRVYPAGARELVAEEEE